jgi:hypothetical protein
MGVLNGYREAGVSIAQRGIGDDGVGADKDVATARRLISGSARYATMRKDELEVAGLVAVRDGRGIAKVRPRRSAS